MCENKEEEEYQSTSHPAAPPQWAASAHVPDTKLTVYSIRKQPSQRRHNTQKINAERQALKPITRPVVP